MKHGEKDGCAQLPHFVHIMQKTCNNQNTSFWYANFLRIKSFQIE